MKFDMTKSKASMTGALLLASLIWGSGTVLMQVCAVACVFVVEDIVDLAKQLNLRTTIVLLQR